MVADTRLLDVDTLPALCRQPRPRGPHSETAVVVISHNYGCYLVDAIDSVLAQSLPAREILVVDDASDDQTKDVAKRYESRGVRYLRINERHVHRARVAGMEATTAPNLIFLDADDRLPCEYIAAAEQQLAPHVGIVTTDLERFGAETGRVWLAASSEIERRNVAHAASLVRRRALQSVRLPGPGEQLPCQSHADWFLWRAVTRAGWRISRSPVALEYRRHPASMLRTTGGETYRVRASLDLESAQIVLPLAGRAQWLPRIQRWVEQQTWPRVSLLVLDTSPDPFFRSGVRAWLSGLPIETQYVPLLPTGDTADLERRNRPEQARAVNRIMPPLYNAARQRLTGEYVFWLEDDVLPPHNVISTLLQSMDEDVACVSGLVPSRFEPGCSMVWGVDRMVQRGKLRGVSACHGTGFGCLLIRRSVLAGIPLHCGGPTGCYDHNVADAIADAELRWLVDWGVGCDHAGVSAESIHGRVQP
jgi:glycosyltransferase involved in cell wall biosynthesis